MKAPAQTPKPKAKSTPTASEQAAKKQKQDLVRQEEARKAREAAEEKAWQLAEKSRNATEILQTSADPAERWRALGALREQPRWLAEWAPELGRIVSEGGKHANYAAELLGATGDEAFPVVAELARSPSLDTRMWTARIVARINAPSERKSSELLRLLQPLLESPEPEKRIAALLPLSGLTLDEKATAEMTSKLTSDPSEFVRVGIAGMMRSSLPFLEIRHPKLASLPRVGDRWETLKKSESAFIRYVGEVEWEVMRRFRDDHRHVIRLTPEEVERRKAAEESLRVPARAALRECAEMVARAGTPSEQLCVFRGLTYLHTRTGQEEDREALMAVVRTLAPPKGSLLELEIRNWLQVPRGTGPQRW
jgi:hypothetical protein